MSDDVRMRSITCNSDNNVLDCVIEDKAMLLVLQQRQSGGKAVLLGRVGGLRRHLLLQREALGR